MEKGDKVTFAPTGEIGIIKKVDRSKSGYIVYHVVFRCNNDWDNYENYTSCLTYGKHLKKGWKLVKK